LALDGPVPWADPSAAACGVVHLTGDLNSMARANFEATRGLLPAHPMLIVGQQHVADPSRAPAGTATLWIETHVPPHPRGDGADEDARLDGWTDATKAAFLERMLARLEHFAPGTRGRIVASFVRSPSELQAINPNLVGGDVGGGSSAIDQQLVFRPVPGWFRYKTPVRGLFLCSASAHPGGGVHGMAGYNAAKRVLRASRSPRGVLTTATGARRAPSRP
jgi:phytoene dehydrogenase-like protein